MMSKTFNNIKLPLEQLDSKEATRDLLASPKSNMESNAEFVSPRSNASSKMMQGFGLRSRSKTTNQMSAFKKMEALSLRDYKAKLKDMGVRPDQSVFEAPEVRKKYYEARRAVMDDFHERNNVSYDFDKKVYLEEISGHMNNVLQAYLSKDIEAFSESINKIAYLALIKQEFQLAMKTYNILGHALMTWKDWPKAYKCFVKLKDVAKMGGDLETSMYAFKQMGFALNQNKEYNKAAKAFKCQL